MERVDENKLVIETRTQTVPFSARKNDSLRKGRAKYSEFCSTPVLQAFLDFFTDIVSFNHVLHLSGK